MVIWYEIMVTFVHNQRAMWSFILAIGENSLMTSHSAICFQHLWAF